MRFWVESGAQTNILKYPNHSFSPNNVFHWPLHPVRIISASSQSLPLGFLVAALFLLCSYPALPACRCSAPQGQVVAELSIVLPVTFLTANKVNKPTAHEHRDACRHTRTLRRVHVPRKEIQQHCVWEGDLAGWTLGRMDGSWMVLFSMYLFKCFNF